MTWLADLYDRACTALDAVSGPVLTTLARFLFAATLLLYFWNSALTKLGDGISGLWTPALGAYAQIFPRQMEAVGYDVSQLGLWHWAVVMAGTYAEILLPLMVVIGLFTRFAALGMIGFVTVQSLTDIVGHGAAAGSWFDRLPDGVILDQRALWLFLLLLLALRGGGPLSVDRWIRSAPSLRPASPPQRPEGHRSA